MLEDRPYMRSQEFRSGKPVWMILIIVNVACFALQMINAVYIKFPITEYLLLSPTGLSRGYVWQLLTFQFFHADFFHLLSNMFFGVWMFGRYIEDRLGKINFLKIYFLSGIAGGLLQVTLGMFVPNVFGGATLGASAGAFGLVAAFCALDPNAEIRLFFVLPMRAKHLLYMELGIALFFTLVPTRSVVAHAAHLGGALFALAFIRWGVLSASHSMSLWKPFTRRPKRPRELVGAAPKAKRRDPTPAVQEDLPPKEFISKEVDPILDKISAHGIQSLTDREKEILEAARKKMAKR